MRSVKPAALVVVAVLIVGLVDPVQAQVPGPVTVDLKNPAGQNMGKVTLTSAGSGLDLTVEATGLRPGQHGLHLHAIGRCDGPDFVSAGGHVNPLGKQHGVRNPLGSHLGDLPNLTAADDGRARLTARSMATLTPGPGSVFDADGTALIIHAEPDDEATDPTGNSGGRIACAPLAPGAQPSAQPVQPGAQTSTQAVRAPAQLPRTGTESLPLGPLTGLLGGLLVAAGLLARRRLS